MEGKNTKQIDSYLLIKKISSLLLAITTGCGAFYIGYAQFSGPVLSITAGLFAAVVAILSIDVLLGAVMDDLFDRDQSNPGKWMLMIFLLCMSGGATGFFAYVIGEKMGAPESVEVKQIIRASISDNHSEMISANQHNANQLKKDIRALTYQFKKDTAAIIAQMPENHQRLYRKGLHARYMTRSGYATLKENVSRIDTRINQYLTDLDAKKSALSIIESGLAGMLSSDPLQDINAELAAADQRAKKEGDMFKGIGWIVDVGLALSLFFSFLFARKKIVNDPTISAPQNEFHSWVLARWKNLSEKLLSNTDVADGDLQYFVKNFVKAFSASAGLLGFLADVYARFISIPKDYMEKKGDTGTTNGLQSATTARQTTAPNMTTNERLAIGFRQNTGATDVVTTKPEPTIIPKPATPVGTNVAADLSRTTKRDPVVYKGESSGMTTKATKGETTSIRVVNYIGEPHVIHNGKKRNESWIKKQVRDYTKRLEDYKSVGKDTTTVKANLALFDRYLSAIDREKKSII